MKITKLGHSCLLVEEQSLRILIDPGNYSTGQNELKNIDVLLITQEHQDHCDIGSIWSVLHNNPSVRVLTNDGTGAVLKKEKIRHDLVRRGESMTVKGVLIEGYGKDHAEIYRTLPKVENTGYLIARRLYHPGDAFHNPGVRVEILALPVAGPWAEVSEAIDYAREVNPKICFPIHDGMLRPDRTGSAHSLPAKVLEPYGIKFVILDEGKAVEV